MPTEPAGAAAEPSPTAATEPDGPPTVAPTEAAEPATEPTAAAEPTEPAEPTTQVEPTEAVEPTVAVEPTEAAEPTPAAEATEGGEPAADGPTGAYTIEGENDLGYVAQEDIELESHGNLKVQNVGYYTSGIGSLWFFGEVVNNGKEDAAAIAVLINLYNDRNERLARGGSLRAATNVLKPGEKSVWFSTMSDAPSRWAKTQIEVGQTISAESLLEEDYAEMEARNMKLIPPKEYETRTQLTGTLVNTGKGPVDSITVTGVLYRDGKIVDIATGLVEKYENPIPAGKSSPFSINFLREHENPEELEFEVYLAGEEPLE
jgi:hypothetical protein